MNYLNSVSGAPDWLNSMIGQSQRQFRGNAVQSARQGILPTAPVSRDYTPNQFTARQLASIQTQAPLWMQQAYANKMAGFAPAGKAAPGGQNG